MSRRRKYGDIPILKNTPYKAAAAEECNSVIEPGRRRPRSARRSGLRVAGEGPPGPGRPQEQRPAAASCSKSNPEEKYETPRQVLKMDLLSCTFSSPNDPDGQNDIFWDQNSPLTKQLGKGRRKQIYSTDSDEISRIVNRIAPQDEKPTTDSMLGVWIGDTAIPCTPSVAKEKSRVKISCTKVWRKRKRLLTHYLERLISSNHW
uniref:ETAA1 activator of ATR kinase n=1 Tax=Castor canadensis TaxID=51338 RepID=A0A8C0XQ47_CASCN